MSNMYEDPIYDEVGTSYDSNIPSEVQDHDYYLDNVDEYHQVHEMQSNVQHNYVVNSYADYTNDSNIILYDQYMEDNEEHVVQSNVSSVRNDALMSIIDDMHEQKVVPKIKILETQLQEKDNAIRSCKTYNAKDVTYLIEQNDSVREELEKVQTTSSNVKPIPHPLKNNRSAHLNYINHLKESVEIVREIVKEARVVKPLDNALNYACQYTKLSQELLEYVIGTCPKNREVHQSNVTVIPSTGVSSSTGASESKPKSYTKHNRILPAKSVNKKEVEEHLRTIKSVWTKVNRVDSSISSKCVVINSNSESVCKTCNKCLIFANHDMCVVKSLSYVNATPTVKNDLNKAKQV
ncbi:hypothetical protein Tco_0722336 [Tanacetum coccineum]